MWAGPEHVAEADACGQPLSTGWHTTAICLMWICGRSGGAGAESVGGQPVPGRRLAGEDRVSIPDEEDPRRPRQRRAVP